MNYDVHSIPTHHYMKTTCPVCTQKVKVIRVAVDRRTLAVHSTKRHGFIQCPGSAKHLSTMMKIRSTPRLSLRGRTSVVRAYSGCERKARQLDRQGARSARR